MSDGTQSIARVNLARAPMLTVAAGPARIAIALIVSAHVLCSQTATQPQPDGGKSPANLHELSDWFEALAGRVSPAVVQVVSSGFAPVRGEAPAAVVVSKRRSTGSGVIVDPNGLVITNAHVIVGAQRVQVLLASRTKPLPGRRSILSPRAKFREAKIVGFDVETDLAVLKIEAQDLPFVPFGDSDDLRPGQLVFAFGSPLGLENSVTMGVVSSVARQLRPGDPMIYIQTDTAMNPGNSGGPLVNADGQIVGINTLIFSQSGGNEGIGFAAPSNIVRTVFEQIQKQGRVRRGEIGVHVQTITPELAVGLGLPRDWGVILADVKPGGPGYIGGLKLGDIVLTLDGKTMENGRQFDVNVYQRTIGDVVEIKVLRGSEELTVRVTVLEREGDPEQLARMVSRQQNAIARLGILGISLNPKVAEIMPPLRRSTGVVVAGRLADGPYWSSLFQPGDVIYRVNQKPTTGLRELRAVLAELREDTPVVVQIERLGRLMFVTFELE